MKHFSHFLIIALTIQQITLTAPPAAQIIRHILTAESSKQTKLLLRQANEQYICATPLTRDKRQEKIEHLKEMAPTLTAAIKKLHGIPGFENTLHIVLQSLHLPTNGQFYEIEKALAIAHPVLAMNSPIILPEHSSKTFFDLITPEKYIECKAIHWYKNISESSPITAKLLDQFLRQQKTVARLNQLKGTEYTYEVHSKFPVPDVWMEWFEKQNISIIQEKS